MATDQTPESSVADAPRATDAAQRYLAQLARAPQRFAKNLFEVANQQAEVNRDLIESGVADFSLLGKAGTPAALVEAECEIFRRASERAIDAGQRFTDQFCESWTEAFDFGPPPAPPHS